MTPSSSHPYNCQDFILLLFLNLSETFALNEEVTEFQEVMLKGKPVKQLNDSNLNQIRSGTCPFRIRSLLIYLKQVSLHSNKVFSQDVFIQKWRFQNTFLRHEQSWLSLSTQGTSQVGMSPWKRWSNVQFSSSSVVPFPSFTSSAANSDQQEASQEALLRIISEGISTHHWAANLRLSMGPCQEWAEGTSDQKSLKKTDCILYIVYVHLSFVCLFPSFYVDGWYKFMKSLICFKCNKICCGILKKQLIILSFQLRMCIDWTTCHSSKAGGDD